MAGSQKDKTQTSSGADDLGMAEVQARFDEAEEKGYFGNTPDETPNENYTLKGVTSGKPTPENQRGK
jgi:hypothetical protein